MVHHKTDELVEFICNEIAKSNYSSVEKIFLPPLFQAISAGIHEIVEAILGSYPNAIHFQNQKKQSIFHHAVVCRRENVFNIIHQDKSKNNALHLAGYLAPQQQLYLRAGAALQMQRELQWFKEVEKHVVPRNKEERNYDGMTPTEVFIDKHKELVKEGEQWMKDRANAYSVVAALIATVMFMAAITVPGGSNDNGVPKFKKRASFVIFSIFDDLALFSSMTSVSLFLSIVTSRYAADDFLVTCKEKITAAVLPPGGTPTINYPNPSPTRSLTSMDSNSVTILDSQEIRIDSLRVLSLSILKSFFIPGLLSLIRLSRTPISSEITSALPRSSRHNYQNTWHFG
ncbi:hypothetical protein ACSBR2_028691 [Camellia fascicularis]